MTGSRKLEEVTDRCKPSMAVVDMSLAVFAREIKDVAVFWIRWTFGHTKCLSDYGKSETF